MLRFSLFIHFHYRNNLSAKQIRPSLSAKYDPDTSDEIRFVHCAVKLIDFDYHVKPNSTPAAVDAAGTALPQIPSDVLSFTLKK